jgi:hypothetical protein
MGHACGLLAHFFTSDERTNLMHTPCNPQRRQLSKLQTTVIRASRYVTYF